MWTHLKRHRLLTSAALAALVLASIGANEPAKKETAPESERALRVAVMPIVNGSPRNRRGQDHGGHPPRAVRGVPHGARHVPQNQPTPERLLADRNELDRAYTLNDRWSKYGTLDTTAVSGLDSLLLVDAILCVRIAEWENVRVNVVGRGESNSTVGLQFALYDLKSLKKTWSKEPREQRFAHEVDPTSGSVTYDETGYIQSRSVTDPPRLEDVANDLVRTAFKKFPRK